jgi:DNA polymerase III psi subunit
MSLDNIHLSPLLVQQFYKRVMVDVKSTEGNSEPAPPVKIPSLGTNNKHIIIVINEGEFAYLSEDDMTLLTGILQACKLSMADVAILNFAKNRSLNYESILASFNPEFTIMFGVSPADLSFPLQFPLYQLQRYNQKSFLASAPLKVLAEDVEQKKQLWSCLQKHFFDN